MAYESAAENIALLKRTIIGSFDFSGRSRRTEVIYYWIVTAIINAVFGFIISAALEWTLMLIAKLSLSLILAVPFFSLFARRLHDQGRSALWAVILPILIVINIVQSIRFIISSADLNIGQHSAVSAVTIWAGIPLAIAYLAFTFLPGTSGSNRFGPDPRLEVID